MTGHYLFLCSSLILLSCNFNLRHSSFRTSFVPVRGIVREPCPVSCKNKMFYFIYDFFSCLCYIGLQSLGSSQPESSLNLLTESLSSPPMITLHHVRQDHCVHCKLFAINVDLSVQDKPQIRIDLLYIWAQKSIKSGPNGVYSFTYNG